MIPFGLQAWARRNAISSQALIELGALLDLNPPPPGNAPPHSEAWVQARERLASPRLQRRLWRNNVGVLKNPETGQPVRYGLANDSSKLNAVLKSGDLIGWTRVVIGPEHLGTTVAVFTSLECKRVGWTFSGTDREEAQAAWAALVNSEGGLARFTTGPDAA